MANGMLSFLGGMANGYITESNRNQALERQDRMDAMALKEHDAKMDEIDRAKRAADQAEAVESARAASQAPTTAAEKAPTETATINLKGSNGEDITVAQPDPAYAANTAKLLSESRAESAPVVGSAFAVGGNANKKLFTGLNAAAQAKKYSDDNFGESYADNQAKVARIRSMPGGEKVANEMATRYEALRKEGALRALSLLNSGNKAGALAAFNAVGDTKTPEGSYFKDNPNGINPLTGARQATYQLVDKDGGVLVSDVHSAIYNHVISPLEQLKLQEKRKEGFTLKAGETKFSYDANGVPHVAATNDNGYVTDESGNTVKVNGAKAATKGTKDNVQEIRNKIISESLGDNKPAIAEASSHAAMFNQNYPAMPPEVAAHLGVRKQAFGGSNEADVLNPNTGLVERIVTDASVPAKDGKGTSYRGTEQSFTSSARPLGDTPADATIAQTAVAKLQKTDPELFAKYKVAATPEGRAQILAAAKSNIDAIEKAATEAIQANPEKKTIIVSEAQRRIEEIQGRGRMAMMVGQYYQEPVAKPPTTETGAVAAPAVDISGMGQASRAVGLQAALKAKEKARIEAMDVEKSNKNKLTADARSKGMTEARLITSSVIGLMTPEEASASLLKYEEFIPEFWKKEALRKRAGTSAEARR